MIPASEPRAARGERWSVRWTAAVVLATVAISIGSPLLGLRVFHAADSLRSLAPWKSEAPAGFRASNSQVTDTVNAVVPMRAEFRRRALDGDFALWTGYPSGGSALGAVPDIGTLSPLSLPYLLVPLWYAPGLGKLVELAVAIGFTFLFLRRLGLDRAPALVGGTVFAFSGFQVVWTNWPQSQVGALVPALFWAVERCAQRGTFRAALPVALVVAAMFFAGFPAVTAYSLVVAGIYAVVRVGSMRERAAADRLRLLVSLGAAVGLGVGLAAIQLLPFVDVLGDLGLEYREQLRGIGLPLRALATLAVPDAFGSPADRLYFANQRYGDLQSFVGAGALVLVAAAALRGFARRIPRGVWPFFWAAALGVGVVVYLGGPPLRAFQEIPFMAINRISRMRVLFGFLLAILAALGLQAVSDGGEDADAERPALRRRMLPFALWALVSAGLVVGFAQAAVFADRRGFPLHEHLGFVAKQIWPALVGAAAVVLALALGKRVAPGGRHLAVWVVPPVVALECLAFAIPFWPRIARDDFYPSTATHAFLRGDLGADRVAAAGRTLEPGATTYYGLRSVTAHAFQRPTWADLLATVDPESLGHRTFPMLAATEVVAASPILDRLAARYFVTAPEDPVLGETLPAPKTRSAVELAPGTAVSASARAGSVRAVVVSIAQRPAVVDRYEWLDVEVRDRSGRLLTRGSRRVFPRQRKGAFWVPVVEHRRPGGRSDRLDVRLSLRGSRARLALEGIDDDRPAISIVAATDDGLRLAFADGAVAYRRLNALPRIRWAARARAVEDPARRRALLAAGLPRDTVVLSEPGPPGSGSTGVVEIEADTGDEVRLAVDAAGDGYAVVADAMQQGWEASIDGRPAVLRHADHAGVAVFVPRGEHRVVLRYRPASWRAGLLVSAVSLLVLVTFALARPRARRRQAAAPGPPASP